MHETSIAKKNPESSLKYGIEYACPTAKESEHKPSMNPATITRFFEILPVAFETALLP
jgi:ABC-type transport system involved in Fe-S cluster assembly fused permease/ATPase subunit